MCVRQLPCIHFFPISFIISEWRLRVEQLAQGHDPGLGPQSCLVLEPRSYSLTELLLRGIRASGGGRAAWKGPTWRAPASCL